MRLKGAGKLARMSDTGPPTIAGLVNKRHTNGRVISHSDVGVNGFFSQCFYYVLQQKFVALDRRIFTSKCCVNR